jgi:hypothetical protein
VHVSGTLQRTGATTGACCAGARTRHPLGKSGGSLEGSRTRTNSRTANDAQLVGTTGPRGYRVYERNLTATAGVARPTAYAPSPKLPGQINGALDSGLDGRPAEAALGPALRCKSAESARLTTPAEPFTKTSPLGEVLPTFSSSSQRDMRDAVPIRIQPEILSLTTAGWPRHETFNGNEPFDQFAQFSL